MPTLMRRLIQTTDMFKKDMCVDLIYEIYLCDFFSPTLFCLIKISMRAITNLLSWFYFRLLSLLLLPCHVQTVIPMPSFKIGYRVWLNMLLHHPCDAIKVRLVVIHHSLFKFFLKLSEQHYHIYTCLLVKLHNTSVFVWLCRFHVCYLFDSLIYNILIAAPRHTCPIKLNHSVLIKTVYGYQECCVSTWN